jgi:hypothetical protein
MSENELKNLAITLNFVSPDFLQKTTGESIHWFYDGVHNELYYTTDDHGLIKFHMAFMSNYIEGGRLIPLRTGRVDEGRSKIMTPKESNLIRFDAQINLAITLEAKIILNYIKELPENEAQAIIQLIIN